MHILRMIMKVDRFERVSKQKAKAENKNKTNKQKRNTHSSEENYR